ncbi:MAG TPA: hypothetical protein VIL33_01495 [Rhodothermia bacterium]
MPKASEFVFEIVVDHPVPFAVAVKVTGAVPITYFSVHVESIAPPSRSDVGLSSQVAESPLKISFGIFNDASSKQQILESQPDFSQAVIGEHRDAYEKSDIYPR